MTGAAADLPAHSLQRLVGIVEAPPVSLLWPPSPVLVLVAVLAGALLMRWLLRAARRWRANRYRREALALCRDNTAAPLPRLLHARELLKRTAMVAYGRESVAALSGQAWWRFLDEQQPGAGFGGGLGAAVDRCAVLGEAPAAATLRDFEAAAARWIANHSRDGDAPC